MKNLHSCFFTLLAGFMFFTACTPDDDISGDPRDKFIGSWLCRDSSKTTGDVRTYSISITKEGEFDEVSINNFYDLGSSNPSRGVVSGTSIVVPNQTVDGFVLNGSGVYNDGEFFIEYSSKLGSDTDLGIAEYQ